MISRSQDDKIINETGLLVYVFLKTNDPNNELLDRLDISKYSNITLDNLIYEKGDGSDIGLSNITGISSSTVQRRLTDKDRFERLFGSDGSHIFEVVQSIRKKNKQDGKNLGA